MMTEDKHAIEFEIDGPYYKTHRVTVPSLLGFSGINTRLKMNIREPLEIQYMLLALNLSIHILLVLITLFFFLT